MGNGGCKFYPLLKTIVGAHFVGIDTRRLRSVSPPAPLLPPVAQLRHWRVEVEDRVSHGWPACFETTPNEGGRNSTVVVVVVVVRFFGFIETAPLKSGEVIISHGFCSQKFLFGSFDFLFILKSYHFVLESRDEIKHDRKMFFFGWRWGSLRIPILGVETYWQIHGFRCVSRIAYLSYLLLIHWFYWLQNS